MKLKILNIWILMIFAFRVDSQTTTAPPQTTPKDVFVDNVCICVPKGACQDNSDGGGKLDARIMTSGGDPNPITGSNNGTLMPATVGVPLMVDNQTKCDEPLEICCMQYYSCGRVYPPVANAPSNEASQGQAPYGSFPWHVGIIKADSNDYVAGASLISHDVVITAAHKLALITEKLEALLGEWDASKTTEPLNTLNIAIKKVVIHPNFNPKNLKNNLALLFLETPVPLGENPVITNICLPSRPLVNLTSRCWVSGWGKSDFSTSSKLQEILKAVDVPLVDSERCLALLRATRLGTNFKLDSSFICAGGEYAKDACIGDGGSPLSCSIGGINFLAGIVSWGIGCGMKDVPGVYANIHSMLDWIQQTIKANSKVAASAMATTASNQGSSSSALSTTNQTTSSVVTTTRAATSMVSNATSPTTTTVRASSNSTSSVVNTSNATSTSTMSTRVTNSTLAQNAATKNVEVSTTMRTINSSSVATQQAGLTKSNLPLVMNSTTTTMSATTRPLAAGVTVTSTKSASQTMTTKNIGSGFSNLNNDTGDVEPTDEDDDMTTTTTTAKQVVTNQVRSGGSQSDPNTLKFAKSDKKNSKNSSTSNTSPTSPTVKALKAEGATTNKPAMTTVKSSNATTATTKKAAKPSSSSG